MSDERSLLLDRFRVVLQEPQDLVNIALVVRAMKNMGLGWLRLVRPAEFDAYRIEGIAHDTRDVVDRTVLYEELEEAVGDADLVAGTSARRRSSRRRWLAADKAGPALVEQALEGQRIALVFGPEHRGLSNAELDFCDMVINVPTAPEHTSLNLGHAAVILFYELWKTATCRTGATPRDLRQRRRDRVPPASSEEMERLLERWQEAMETIGLFAGVDPLPKMRSFRSIFQRASIDRREAGLLEATAFEILHYEQRTRRRLRGDASEASEDRP